MTSVFGERDIPYASCVADILLKGDWELFTVKVNHEQNLDCMCCGHKHLKYNYWIVRADLPEEKIREYQNKTFLKVNQSKTLKKNPFLHNNTYVSAGMVDEHDKFLCVGSECVTRIIKDDSTLAIMKGVEALRNKIDRMYKERVLKVQMKEYLLKNEKRFTALQVKAIDKIIAEKKAKGAYYSTWQAERNKEFFSSTSRHGIIRQMEWWNPNTTRKLANDKLRLLGCRKNTLVKTARLTDEQKILLDEQKEKQMQEYIEGQRKIFEGKYQDMKWCDVCKTRVRKEHSHKVLDQRLNNNGVNNYP
jgi:hypothetical protein